MQVNDKKTIAIYYQALLHREESFVGIFYAGVKTTSVFCISNCRARKPKPENIEFFTTVKDALDYGYRPCKICRPAENAYEAPESIKQAMHLIRSNPKQKIPDYQLKENNISPEQVRRWFQKNYGMTFQAYQRMYRINSAFNELKTGTKITDTAFDSGYESLSGFGYTFKKLIGRSPMKSMETQIVSLSRLTSPLGPMFVAATEKGICLLEFTDRRMLETEMKDLQKSLHARIIPGENEHIRQAKKELEEYFAGTRQYFDVKLDPVGSDFQAKVWMRLMEIPYGRTISYMEQALTLQMPAAIRAVAASNGLNKIAIIIPCHRVIGSNGKLTGYGGGLERKRWLINHERTHSSDPLRPLQLF
jgi:AraC family transcriptional regulator, regulatory protein of adaptative response / methylated-DNA-[protein]-cysteine methyltransferase